MRRRITSRQSDSDVPTKPHGIVGRADPCFPLSEHRLLLEAALEEYDSGDGASDVTNQLQFAMTSSEEAVVELPPPLYQSFEG